MHQLSFQITMKSQTQQMSNRKIADVNYFLHSLVNVMQPLHLSRLGTPPKLLSQHRPEAKRKNVTHPYFWIKKQFSIHRSQLPSKLQIGTPNSIASRRQKGFLPIRAIRSKNYPPH